MNLEKEIIIDLGKRLGKVSLPRGSKIYFDGAIPILQKSIWFWNTTSLILKSHLMDYGLECHLTNNLENQSNELNYDAIIFEDSILPWLYNSENNPTFIFIKKPNISVDYVITLNGIFDCNANKFIKEFEFLTENSQFINMETGLDALSGRLGLSPTRLTTYRHIINGLKESESNPLLETIHSDLTALSLTSIFIISNKNIYNYPEVSFYSVKSSQDIPNSLDFLNYAFDTMLSKFIPENSIPTYFELVNCNPNTLLESLKDFFIKINEESIFNYIYSIDYVLNYTDLLKSNKIFINSECLKNSSFSSIFISKLFETNSKGKKNNLFIDIFKETIKCKKSSEAISSISNMRHIDRLFISNYSYKDMLFGSNSIYPQPIMLYHHDVRHYTFKYIKKENNFIFKCMQGGVRTIDICNSNRNSFITNNSQIINLIKESNLVNLKQLDLSACSDFNNYNIFSLIMLYSTNFKFAKEFFEYCLKIGFTINEKDYSVLDILVFRNINFNDSDLLLFADYLISNHSHLSRYDHPSILIKKIFNIHNLPNISNIIKNDIFIKFFPIALLKDISNDTKIELFNNISTNDLVSNIDILTNPDLTDICQKIFNSKGKLIKKYYIRNLERSPIESLKKISYVFNIFNTYDQQLFALSKIDALILSLKMSITTPFSKIDNIKKFLLQYPNLSNNTKIRFFIDNVIYIHLIEDTHQMAQEYTIKSNSHINPNEFTSIAHLHEWLRLEIAKFKNKKFLFNNSKILFIDNHSFAPKQDTYIFKLPESNHDVMKTAALLHNCIGSDHYIDRHNKLSNMIVNIIKNNDLYAVMFCELIFNSVKPLELISSEIREIKKKNNEALPKQEIDIIQNQLDYIVRLKKEKI